MRAHEGGKSDASMHGFEHIERRPFGHHASKVDKRDGVAGLVRFSPEPACRFPDPEPGRADRGRAAGDPLDLVRIAIAPAGSVRPDSPLVVIHRNPQREDGFWIRTDNSIGNAWRDDNVDGGQWHTQNVALANTVLPGSPLVAFSRFPNMLELFWLGDAGDVSSTYLVF